ncbi:hypothetical protein DEU56DRAFT_757083 [Suillus clintonianus]|uniref:uncharacterized protein n=1 Tax=Suillus clintonianus TaxID=1904413 RepID=UPI001B86A3AB|nr:uncharacterized protein DEU56DRAFT_757083 [Suillus clintonianus]KAG2133745.1 hypothetical protein DEU56DRAFT_757083 [Suillus clintonianus]
MRCHHRQQHTGRILTTHRQTLARDLEKRKEPAQDTRRHNRRPIVWKLAIGKYEGPYWTKFQSLALSFSNLISPLILPNKEAYVELQPIPLETVTVKPKDVGANIVAHDDDDDDASTLRSTT